MRERGDDVSTSCETFGVFLVRRVSTHRHTCLRKAGSWGEKPLSVYVHVLFLVSHLPHDERTREKFAVNDRDVYTIHADVVRKRTSTLRNEYVSRRWEKSLREKKKKKWNPWLTVRVSSSWTGRHDCETKLWDEEKKRYGVECFLALSRLSRSYLDWQRFEMFMTSVLMAVF